MKSHISRKSDTDILADKLKSQIMAAYKRKTAAAYIGSMLLAAFETNGIGGKRMGELLDNFGEWLDYFCEYTADGVGYDILVKRLEERGLRELFEALMPSEEEFG